MPSKNFDEKIRVVASVIARDSKYLICQRPIHKRHGGLWEFPGGKIRDGESNFDAARRELGEELQVEVVGVGRRLFTAMDPDSPFSIEFFKVEIKGEIEAIEHTEARWGSVFEMTNFFFAPADKRFVTEYLLKEVQ